MQHSKITIDNSGNISGAEDTLMRDFEIAELFGIYTRTAKAIIRELLRSGICRGDFAQGGSVHGSVVYPDYYGLDVIVAIAFRVQSPRAELFRQWVVRKCATADKQPILLQCNYAQTQPSKQN